MPRPGGKPPDHLDLDPQALDAKGLRQSGQCTRVAKTISRWYRQTRSNDTRSYSQQPQCDDALNDFQ